MADTFYSLDALGSGPAFVAALVLGMLFGFVLERAGFGSSRKLAAVFYFTDMTVIKVMFTAVLVAAGAIVFAACEWIERARGRASGVRPGLVMGICAVLLALAAALTISPSRQAAPQAVAAAGTEQQLLQEVEQAADHIEPEDLADRLVRAEPDLLVVDVRPPEEYAGFHLRGAVNVPLPELHDYLQPYRGRGMIVLYSNGMTHPAQARDSLARAGFSNVYLLTDGLEGFIQRCLKPASLRSEPLPAAEVARVNQWRQYFAGWSAPVVPSPTRATHEPLPRRVDTAWLAGQLGQPGLVLLDLRPQPEYNTGHIPGSLRLDVEHLRGNIGGVGSMLLPADMLARHLSLMGITPQSTIVLVPGAKIQDATLAAVALERVGHARYAVLDGGHDKWAAESRTVTVDLPSVTPATYRVDRPTDAFTVDYQAVLHAVEHKNAVLLDVRPAEYYTGQKSEEARAGHIPGAVNRPYTEDVVKVDAHTALKPLVELEKAYQTLLPRKNISVIVYCRTGHQASQTFFVLTQLLQYKNVSWYDGGWSEWAARPELPVATPSTGGGSGT